MVTMNTDKTKKLLEDALKTLPGDNALTSVRIYLKRAIQEITTVEKKRSKRQIAENAIKPWSFDTKTSSLRPPQIGNKPKMKIDALDTLDKMIQGEQAKLDAKKATPEGDDVLFS